MMVHWADTCAFVVPHVCLYSGLDNFVNASNLMSAEYLALLEAWKGDTGCSPVHMGKYAHTHSSPNSGFGYRLFDIYCSYQFVFT